MNVGAEEAGVEGLCASSTDTSDNRLSRLELKLAKSPYDAALWSSYLSECVSRSDPAIIRPAFERLLQHFPTSVKQQRTLNLCCVSLFVYNKLCIQQTLYTPLKCLSYFLLFLNQAKHWIAYLEWEQKHRAFDRMEAIFNKCLRSVISVDLWVFYLNYIRRIHSIDGSGRAGAGIPPEKLDESRATVAQAYDFALGNIGFDKDSAVVWSEYLQFIKAGEVSR